MGFQDLFGGSDPSSVSISDVTEEQKAAFKEGVRKFGEDFLRHFSGTMDVFGSGPMEDEPVVEAPPSDEPDVDEPAPSEPDVEGLQEDIRDFGDPFS